MSKYHDLSHCASTLGIDKLLASYKADKDNVLSLLLSDPEKLVVNLWKDDSLLGIDRFCRSQFCNKRTEYSCSQCSNLKRVSEFRKDFPIEFGSQAGKNLSVTEIPVAKPFLEWDEAAAKRARLYTSQYTEALSCGTPVVERCIAGDSFTVSTLVSWIIGHLAAQKGLNYNPALHTSFVCNGKGYSVSSAVDSEIYDIDMDAQSVKNIILQLLVVLLELSDISFTHGNPIADSLKIQREPCSYIYDGVKVICPFTLQITDFRKSSASFNGTHLFSRDPCTDMKCRNQLFVPQISNKVMKMKKCLCEGETHTETCEADKDIYFYRLTDETLAMYNTIRYSGYPLYSGSFDFYCFMVSLMTIPQFYNIVMAEDEVYSIWSSLWIPSELPYIESEIRDAIERREFCDPYSIIKGRWLRCDILDFVWKIVKKQNA